ncbi:MAG TPA: zinc-binding dehydrogenase [Thermoanaerobaculia bacterium]|jgi:NADPH:quinone reductase-like Zn-dependent oxidoreductase|nr:zinc-binding dehydrogenase [Thermoanaerobaculia bacterium]
MKAIFFTRHGGNEVLQYGERPDPIPGTGEVRVSIRAAALNRLDVFARNGIPGVPLPQIPGADGAGVVDAVGEGVTGVAPGDPVLLQPGLSCTQCEFCLAGEQSLCVTYRILGEHVPGTFAERVVVPRRNVFPIPPGLSFAEAAAFPLAYQTAWRMVVGRGAVRAGETVLIHGVGGGVAGAVLEIAALCGARVLATTSDAEKARHARDGGAELVIDYRKEDVAQAVRQHTGKRGVDVVVDMVGAATWMTSLKAAAKGGRIVTCGATSGPNPSEEIRLIFWKQLSILGSTMANEAEFRALYAAVAARKLRPRIDRVFPLPEAAAAYAYMEEGRQHGKIVLVPEGVAAEGPDGD